METRLFLFTPDGPLCFIDYATELEGQAIMDKIREIAVVESRNKGYEFKLFRRIKDKLVSIDQFFLPRFHRACIDFFVDTARSPYTPEFGY